MDNLFSNIGRKIQVLAMVFFTLGTVGSVISGIIIAKEMSIGYAILFGGPVVSLISNWFLYGFGEIIIKLDKINNTLATYTHNSMKKDRDPFNNKMNYTNGAPKTQNVANANINESDSKPLEPVKVTINECGTITCPNCRTVQRGNRIVCFKCGQPFEVN